MLVSAVNVDVMLVAPPLILHYIPEQAPHRRYIWALAIYTERERLRTKFTWALGGVAGSGGSLAGRINTGLEMAPHFRETEINSSRGYWSRKCGTSITALDLTYITPSPPVHVGPEVSASFPSCTVCECSHSLPSCAGPELCKERERTAASSVVLNWNVRLLWKLQRMHATEAEDFDQYLADLISMCLHVPAPHPRALRLHISLNLPQRSLTVN